jgi:hypothetical protein
MTRQVVSNDQAPAAIGPYSQAIVAGGLVSAQPISAAHHGFHRYHIEAEASARP